jgi:hypothetical protein
MAEWYCQFEIMIKEKDGFYIYSFFKGVSYIATSSWVINSLATLPNGYVPRGGT